MDKPKLEVTRRDVLKGGAIAGAGLVGASLLGPGTASGQLPPITDCGIKEVWATSPFIVGASPAPGAPVTPFLDPLPVPGGMAPGWRRVDGTLDPLAADAWTVRDVLKDGGAATPGIVVPGQVGRVAPTLDDPNPQQDGVIRQDIYGHTHQVWVNSNRLVGPAGGGGMPGPFPEPILYHIRLQVAEHRFTSSQVLPINKRGRPLRGKQLQQLVDAGVPVDPNGAPVALPPSTIYGFNGTFPGPMVNVEYGKPVIVRFENDLDLFPNPSQPAPLVADEVIARSDFGSPDLAFLTHLHNGHTAPESDGQPHFLLENDGGYIPGDWVDNLYLNYPAGGDPAEIQSFLWFHDHRMHHTGANVYKGMVGLFPMYDPVLDPGDETAPAPALGLPGRKRINPDGVSFSVDYDIPMALYDLRLDDGLTAHADFWIDPNLCGDPQPDQWGRTFFRYAPNHGFVGDIFTVNCKAFPVLNVEPRRYRFRFLGASIARCYELVLMTSAAGPVPKPGSLGQWQIPDGIQWRNADGTPKPWTQIASMGGLLTKPIFPDTIQIWPATRREVVVDFTGIQAGTVIYLTNVLDMPNGRKPKFNKIGRPVDRLKYKVPLVKIVVGATVTQPDVSIDLVANPNTPLRPMPVLPSQAVLDTLPHREFTLKRSGKVVNEQWLINKLAFDPLQSLTALPDNPGNPIINGVEYGDPRLGQPEIWTVINGGGGWTHPMHMHQEEHQVITRDGKDSEHPEDPPASGTLAIGKEDVVNLDPGEAVTFYRNFRTFTGPYVAHCHNLAHEDHNMMFGWSIVNPPA